MNQESEKSTQTPVCISDSTQFTPINHLNSSIDNFYAYLLQPKQSIKRRETDFQSQPATKKQRFRWDGSLHFQFLKQLFRYGLDNIPIRRVFDTLRQYSNDITYEFVEKTINSFRENIENTLNSFSIYYNQALHYQDSYSGADTVIGKFSTYPFAPRSVKQLYDECQNLQDQSEYPSIEEVLPSSHSYNHIAVPKFSLSSNFTTTPVVDGSDFQREIAMDSQIQLHQDMLSQNRYYLNRSINNPPTSIVSFGDMVRRSEHDPITSSEDDIERTKERMIGQSKAKSVVDDITLLTDVLSAHTNRFVEYADKYLAEYPTQRSQEPFSQDLLLSHEDNSSSSFAPYPLYNNDNVFDFLQ